LLRTAFFRDVNFDASFITSWAVRYRKRNEPFHRIIKEYEQKIWVYKKENFDLRELALEKELQITELNDKIYKNEEKLKINEEDNLLMKEVIESKNQEMYQIKNSRTWKAIQRITKFLHILKLR